MSKRIRVIKNDEVERLIFSKPKGGEFSIFIETDDEVFVLNHVIVSNISRAYHWVFGHPRLEALEMRLKKLASHERKAGISEKQFVETERAEEEIQKETDAWIAESRIT